MGNKNYPGQKDPTPEEFRAYWNSIGGERFERQAEKIASKRPGAVRVPSPVAGLPTREGQS